MVISELSGCPKTDRTHSATCRTRSCCRSSHSRRPTRAQLHRGVGRDGCARGRCDRAEARPGRRLAPALIAVSEVSEGNDRGTGVAGRSERSHGEEEGERLSQPELRDQVTLLYIAGHETTVNLIGNGTLALLRHPDQLARLRAHPDLIGNAVDELLRFDGPVQFGRRWWCTTTRIDDVRIPRGSLAVTGLGAANHDPDHFGPDADALDVSRRLAPQHLSFGGGIHHCLGAVLAARRGRRERARAPLPHLALATDTPAWNGRMILPASTRSRSVA